MSCTTAPGQVNAPLCGTELYLVIAGCSLLGVAIIAIAAGVLIRITRRRRRAKQGADVPQAPPARPLSAWSASSSLNASVAAFPGTPDRHAMSRMPIMAQVTPIRTPPRASMSSSALTNAYNQPYDPFMSPKSGASTPRQPAYRPEPVVEVLSDQQQQRRSRPRSDYERFVAQEHARAGEGGGGGRFGGADGQGYDEDDNSDYGTPTRYEQRRLSFIPVYGGESPRAQQQQPPRAYGNRI